MLSLLVLPMLCVEQNYTTIQLRRWVYDTARLESNFNDKAIGDNFKSRGRYQIQEATWRHYSKKPWRIYAHDKVEATRVAYLIIQDCAKKCGKRVTFKRIRYYYTHGGF